MASRELTNRLMDFELEDAEDQIVIALDFGTTFSGIAYAFRTEDKPELVSILDWPGLEGEKQPKIPTVISYDPSNVSTFTWGGQKHKHQVIAGIKLLLDPDQTTRAYVPHANVRAEAAKLRKPALEVAADIIRAMYEHAINRIADAVPRDYLENDVVKKFVLSVPAIWSDKAKNATLEAAKLAGIHPVTLIKEPEAAAMYTMHVLKGRGLRIGDAMVVCDAGGGTVDLITYEIEAVKPHLVLKELVPSSGGMAGSLQLNKRFEEAVKRLVGQDQYEDLVNTQAYQEAVRFFDKTVKPAFKGDSNDTWLVNFPMARLRDNPAKGLKRDTWVMKSSVVAEIFAPLIEDIGDMVDDQVNQARNKRLREGHINSARIKAIVLVGGFGSSAYLKRSLERRQPDIQIIQPHDAWSAIVKGAVLSQLPNQIQVTSVVATKHYGVMFAAEWDSTIDSGQDSYYSAYHGNKRCRRMQWFINIGDSLDRDGCVRHTFLRFLTEDFTDSELIWNDTLYTDDLSRASIHLTGAGVKTNCKLTSDLRRLDRSKLSRQVGKDGKMWYLVEYDLVISHTTALMKFSLKYDGKEAGSVVAKYE